MQVNRSAKVEMSRITTLLRQGSHGTKSSINGLGQHILMKGLLVREYLAPDEKAFDKYGGSAEGPIKHYPMYPMAAKNKNFYRRPF